MLPQLDSFDDVQCEEMFQDVSFARNDRFEAGRLLLSGTEFPCIIDNHTNRYGSFVDWGTCVELARELNTSTLENLEKYSWRSFPN